MDPAMTNDPFGDVDDAQRTFIRPTPGGRSASLRMSVDRGAAEPEGVPTIDAASPERGLNPLVALANRLLMIVPQLRNTRHVDDPAAMRDSLAQALRDFATTATARGIAAERVMAARYVLCTMIDEA